jgi:VWFA-related protein
MLGLTTTSVAETQHASADDVLLYVSVTEGGHYLTALGEADFRVFEAGVEQRVVSVTRTHEVPIALTLLLDASNSMAEDYATVQSVGLDFVKRLRSRDVAEVIGFNTRVKRIQVFTNDAGQLERAISGLRKDGSTGLNNAVYAALKDLQKLKSDQSFPAHRHVFVILSDGHDTSSLVPFDTVLDLAKRLDVVLYAIGTGAGQRGFDPMPLRLLATETGGRWVFPGRPADFPKVSDNVMTDLANQYAIRYVSSNPRRDGKWRSIEVQVNAPNAGVRGKPGYFAPKAR